MSPAITALKELVERQQRYAKEAERKKAELAMRPVNLCKTAPTGWLFRVIAWLSEELH